MKVRDRILVITDLLIAAIYCDGTMMGDEEHAARALLADLLLTKPDDLPAEVVERIQNFRLLEFDLDKTVTSFLEDPPMKKRRLLELVGKMVDADGEHDFREDQFVRDLAESLGMEKAEYADLVLEFEVEALPATAQKQRLRESFEDLRAVPPPLPPDAKKA
ncbi:MAG: TerB family tellurite resistance protein [Myxococcota bacterium]